MNTNTTHKNIAKTMNAEQRLERATQLARTYRTLMNADIADGNPCGEEIWKADYRIAFRIVRNMHTMRGIPFSYYSII